MVPSERELVRSCRPYIPYVGLLFLYQHSAVSTRLPKILDWSFEWGLRTPNLWEEETVGGRGGTVRKSVGEFL